MGGLKAYAKNGNGGLVYREFSSLSFTEGYSSQIHFIDYSRDRKNTLSVGSQQQTTYLYFPCIPDLVRKYRNRLWKARSPKRGRPTPFTLPKILVHRRLAPRFCLIQKPSPRHGQAPRSKTGSLVARLCKMWRLGAIASTVPLIFSGPLSHLQYYFQAAICVRARL